MDNSILLNKLMDYAKKLEGGNDATLTAERFIVSVIDLVSGECGFDAADGEIEIIIRVFGQYFPVNAQDFKDVKARLLTKIRESENSTSYIDSIYMQQHIYKAKESASKNNSLLLAPSMLLLCILEDPNEYIKGLIGEFGKSEASQETVTSEEAKPSSDENSDFDKLVKEITEGKKVDDTGKDAPQAPVVSKKDVGKLIEETKRIQDRILQDVVGQDHAVNVFTTGFFRSELLAMTDKDRKRPRAIFLFAGPPGVGKTFLAETAAKALGRPCESFDMSEYSDKEANIEFCGSDNVYKNGKEGNVTSYVAKNPHSVLLFDEIEKAHINVIHLFLQILESGRLRDNFTDKEVSFSDAILIFTTNAGKDLYEDSDEKDFSGVTRKVILKALQRDVNPETGVPYFPGAICSRFASGNVVMFNHITAHDLRQIGKKEVLKHAENFREKFGINVNIDENVYTALVFAEGGNADARTVRSRAESFFDDELYELFRLIESDGVDTGVENLDSIDISVALPEDNDEISKLFVNNEAENVLVFSSEQTCALCSEKSPSTHFINATDVEQAKSVLKKDDISYVLIDLSFGQRGESGYINIEDIESKARDFFWHVRQMHPEISVYLLQTPDRIMNSEERTSFTRQGVRGVLTLSDDGFADEIRTIGEQLHQQRSMDTLARMNKLVSYETAQLIKNDGKTAEIRLFDFETEAAIDAEDSKSILSNVSKPDVRFDQVIGAEEAKKELNYFIEYLKNPKKFMGTGVNSPKGVLLYGPPGTGKTMLAKAMASESDVTFITAEGNQFVNRFQGEGRDRIKELFRTARKYAPSIVFIDEIDAIAKERTGESNSGDTEITLTALLTEMDGFKNDTTKPVFVLAATNFEVEEGSGRSLDQALMRRFDRRIYVDLPTRDERVRYIHLKTEGKPAFTVSEKMIDNIAMRSTGMSLADLESVIELSLRTAIRDGDFKVTDEIFEEAFETFTGGEVKKWDDSQLERTARHEAGHAFLYWQSGETPSYVTIVARGDRGGYMQHGDTEGKAIYTKDELRSRIRTSLGGRAAEIVYYGEKDGISTGASGDLNTATRIATDIICTYGMDEKFGLAVINPQTLKSGELSVEIRNAVNAILSEEMQNAISILKENKASVDALVERLLRDNHVTGEVVQEIFENCRK